MTINTVLQNDLHAVQVIVTPSKEQHKRHLLAINLRYDLQPFLSQFQAVTAFLLLTNPQANALTLPKSMTKKCVNVKKFTRCTIYRIVGHSSLIPFLSLLHIIRICTSSRPMPRQKCFQIASRCHHTDVKLRACQRQYCYYYVLQSCASRLVTAVLLSETSHYFCMMFRDCLHISLSSIT